MALAKGHRQNFDTLRRAMFAGDAALMECQLVATGEPVAVIRRQPSCTLGDLRSRC